MNKKIISLLLICFLLSIDNKIFGQKSKTVKENKITASPGLQDREYWVSLLYKISYPVIHNLAEETLQKNMPVELAPGYFLPAKKVTYSRSRWPNSSRYCTLARIAGR